ncbi:MAG TPA: polyphosphate kinase 1 [Chitinophagaceae bacterium]|nr:polyphosphate kinase 1 [Chitinophagaceae bacterium]
MQTPFLSRDLTWLSFNGRVLEEAAREHVPLMERFKFLSIFSSNLDEFYRVRMPAIMLLHQVKHDEAPENDRLLERARQMIAEQQQRFGMILRTQLIPALQAQDILLLYNTPLPAEIHAEVKAYFQWSVLTFLQIIPLTKPTASFFPKSNALYQVVVCRNRKGKELFFLLTVPSAQLPRFFSTLHNNTSYIIFLEDIIRHCLPLLFPDYIITGAWNIKVTRDAELDLADEYEGDLAAKIEKKLAKRDDGSATRFLYEPGIDLQHLEWLTGKLGLSPDNRVEGGHYHNLKDLGSLPLQQASLYYPPQPPLPNAIDAADAVFAYIEKQDCLLHTPYQGYQPVLRFFNEAATDQSVEEIYVTLYRVAGDSRIVNALITAARNGKKVTVFIELKARFDESNNLHWSKEMKAAGISIINSIPALKVHAKVALVKKKSGHRVRYFGLLATGNLNEITARFYTDHILLTTAPGLVRELELLFIFLTKRRKPASKEEISFKQLLVAQFNLQDRFIDLIDNEISLAKQGQPAGIIIKMNNLEEKKLIGKLYEASAAGVRVQLLVRSICCLQAGLPGVSEHITVNRIVDRYLEHGRVFVFHNGGHEQVFLGSADWMNRNIYRRIEVCFPVYDEAIKRQLKEMIQLQLNDTVQGNAIAAPAINVPLTSNGLPPSQSAIRDFLKTIPTTTL